MAFRIARILLLPALILAGSLYCVAQSADGRTPMFPKTGDTDDRPLTIMESMEKMRIEKEKKEHEQMVGRGEEAVKIVEDLEKSYNQKGHLTESELAKVATVEKLAKQIRNELGGSDDDEDEAEKVVPQNKSQLSDIIKTLRKSTGNLFDELKKTTRFTISASAIQSTNAVLRLARFLQISN